MSVSPLDRLTPPLAVLAKHDTVQAGREALAAGRSFWPHLTVLTAFWVYVALSNVLYANSMQASLSSMKIEHVFAAWDARLIQHLLLYPLFLLSTRWPPCAGRFGGVRRRARAMLCRLGARLGRSWARGDGKSCGRSTSCSSWRCIWSCSRSASRTG